MITGFYAGLFALMLVALIFVVIGKRMKYKVGLGTGGIPDLEQAIRVHGNFVEIVPFALILMGLMDYTDAAPAWFLHVYGITLLLARILHAGGLYQSPYRSKGRITGMILSIVLMLSAGFLLILYYMQNAH